MRIYLLLMIIFVCYSCVNNKSDHNIKTVKSPSRSPVTSTSLVILGTVQDGGSPHIGCKKECCKELFKNPDKDRKVVSLGLVDPKRGKSYLFEATPDIAEQMKALKEFCASPTETPDGIFVTHAHIGHYAGLMYLGKEAMSANNTTVYTMPLMKKFLEDNGPWDQLITEHNISLEEIRDREDVQLTSDLKVMPFRVPHRDEYSETVGYIIEGPDKKALFIPDIDKWKRWDRNIIEEITSVDYAFIDATFYDGEEINNRDISEIPHPFVVESMSLFKDLPEKEKSKIYFIHFNHTNPLLNSESSQSVQVVKNGFNIAHIYDVFEL